jgi:hypothetical protein
MARILVIRDRVRRIRYTEAHRDGYRTPLHQTASLMSEKPDMSSMSDGEHTKLVDGILAALEKNLGIRVTAWERVK